MGVIIAGLLRVSFHSTLAMTFGVEYVETTTPSSLRDATPSPAKGILVLMRASRPRSQDTDSPSLAKGGTAKPDGVVVICVISHLTELS